MTIVLFALLGAVLGKALPNGVEPEAVYVKPTEEDFQRLLRKKGLL